jgi:hypothetical protein
VVVGVQMSPMVVTAGQAVVVVVELLSAALVE